MDLESIAAQYGHLDAGAAAAVRAYATASGKDIHFDVPLSNFAVSAFNQQVEDYIADQVMPQVGVGKQSDKYYIIDKDDFLRVAEAHRAPRTKARKVEFSVSSDSYFAKGYALSNEVAAEDLANQDVAVMLRQNGVELVTGHLRRAQEVRVADLITSISNVGSGVQLTGTDKWSDNGSDPVADVRTAHAFIRQNTGLTANTMVIDEDTLALVRTHPMLLDMYKYTSGGQITDQQLREVFRVQRILVGRGVKQNALEGGTSSITNIWGNNVIIARIGPAAGLQAQTLGVRFTWRPPIFPANFGVQRNTVNQAGSEHVEIIEAGHYQDEKVVAADLGYVIADTI